MSGFEQIVDFNLAFKKRRSVPGAVPLVEVGDRVESGTPILEVFEKGELLEVGISKYYNLTATQFSKGLKVSVSDRVAPGTELFSHSGFLGIGVIELRSPVSGTIVNISRDNQTITIELEPRCSKVLAFYRGSVLRATESAVDIEGHGNLCQGVFGFGGETYGCLKNLRLYDRPLKVEEVDATWRGQILVGVKTVEKGVFIKLREIGVSGVVLAHCNPNMFAELNVEVSANVSINFGGFAVMLTERFNESQFQERVLKFFEELDNCPASLNAHTQIRAGSVRPELWVWSEHVIDKPATVVYRVVTDPYWNKIFNEAVVKGEGHTYESGVSSESVVLKNDSKSIVVPATAVERIKIFH